MFPTTTYADPKYYRETFKGDYRGKPGDLRKLLERAAARVDALTLGRARAKWPNGLTPFQRDALRMAVCHQADYYAENGPDGEAPIGSYSAGGLSVKFEKPTPAEKARFSGIGYEILEQSGLLWKGV